MQVANFAFSEATTTQDLLRKPQASSGGVNPLVLTGAHLLSEPRIDPEKITSAPASTQERDKAADIANMADAIAQINDFLQSHGRNLKFKIDKDTGRTVVQIIDSATDEVLRQIPPQEILDIAKRLGDVEGLLFRGDA